MADQKNAPAQRKPTGQELDEQYDQQHQGGEAPARQGGSTTDIKNVPGRKPTGQELDEQYDQQHQGAGSDAPPPA